MEDRILPQPTVMLTSFGNPSFSWVGEQFINSMISNYPRSKLVRYSVMREHCNSSPIDWDGSPAYANTIRSSTLPGYSSLLDWYYRIFIHKYAKQVLRLIEKHDVKVLWIFLNHPAIIHLIHALIPKLTIPYVTTVWDTPEHIIKCMHIDPVTSQSILNEFSEVIRKASDVVTISPQMSEIYRNRFQVKSTPMSYCPPAAMWKPDKNYANIDDDNINVIFAGSLYALREWYSFVEAVEYRNRITATQKIRVTCMGKPSRWLRRHSWVTYIGQQPMAQATDTVNAADVAYLPYWMDAKHAYSTQTAFPSKLPFYLSAGIPILYHGPRDSTPTAFIDKYPVGSCCHTHHQGDILDALDTCTRGGDFLRQYPSARQRAFEEVFNPTLNTDKFNEIVQHCFRTNCD